MSVSVFNRGPEEASVHVLPQLWFRNTWSWGYDSTKPALRIHRHQAVRAKHEVLGEDYFYLDGHAKPLSCENDTNPRRLYGRLDAPGYFKDAFSEYLIEGKHSAVNPELAGQNKDGRSFLSSETGRTDAKDPCTALQEPGQRSVCQFGYRLPATPRRR